MSAAPRPFGFIPPQTPALVIDRGALDANIATMQRRCDAAGVRLRAHGKMHKSSRIAQRQIAAGAAGLCCQTVGEAEAFAKAGVADLLVSAPLPRWGAPRLAALAKETGATIAAVADSAHQIDALADAASAAGVTLGAMVDVNIGMHRAGVYPADAAALARAIRNASSLRYDGVQAYFGHLQHLCEGREAAVAAATEQLRTLVASLAAQGLDPPQVSGGGTGSHAHDLAAGVFTELQCGSYALMDAEYEDCGAPGEQAWPFAAALWIVASVVSARHKGLVTIDAGLKAVSADVAPRVIAGAPAGSPYRSLGDEHGAVIHPGVPRGDPAAIDADASIAWPADAPREGDMIWLQPGHCDPTINLHDGFWAVDADGTADWWPVDARRVTRV